MDTVLLGSAAPSTNGWHGQKPAGVNGYHRPEVVRPWTIPDAEVMRRCAWEIGEKRPAYLYKPTASHAGLAMVSPYRGFAHWRILPEWIEQTAWQRGDAWREGRLVLRLYDVSYLIFNGFNAHRIEDLPLPAIEGHLSFRLPRPGTWQLAEVGFVLLTGEFIPAARSQVIRFAPDAGCSRTDQSALLVDDHGRVEEVSNLWDQERVLSERRKPKLRKPLSIAAFAFESLASGQQGLVARFVSELATGQCAQGHLVHVFVPATEQLPASRQVGEVQYHPLQVDGAETPVEVALNFAKAVEKHLQDLPPFDLFHLHEWMTGLAPWVGTRPTVLSLSSLEATRRNGTAPSPLSLEIQQAERELARAVDCVLTPDWLREKAVAELGINGTQVHPFPMEASVGPGLATGQRGSSSPSTGPRELGRPPSGGSWPSTSGQLSWTRACSTGR